MHENLYDVIVIGGGPAGLTAALYLARARYRVLVIEKEQFGGQITITADVVNYPGVERGSGEEITDVMRRQAQSFGAEFLLAEAEELLLDEDIKTIKTTRGVYTTFGVVIASGAYPRSIGFTGESTFKGRGVAYCATCDGEFFTGLDVFVVGGGFAAAEESIFLTKYARQVTVLVREEDFTCARATSDPVKQHEKIKIHYDTVVEEVSGDIHLQLLRYKNTKTGEEWIYTPPEGETFGVFVFAGYVPNTHLVQGLVELDKHGYIITDQNQKTSREGVYAAGDVCIKNLRQMVTATADGAIAATELERHAAAMQAKTGVMPKQPISRITQSPGQKEEPAPNMDGEFFTQEIRAQLNDVFNKMQNPLLLKVSLDNRPVSSELRNFIQEFTGLTDQLKVEFQEGASESEAPCISVCQQDGTDTGISFHGVPGGHEFNSFVLGLYNASGPGQSMEPDLIERIHAIQKPISMKLMVSLSCNKCPDLVMAAQRIAVENPLIRADAYDINHFEALKDTYKVMSVPCLIVNDETVSFGKKNIPQLLEWLESLTNAQ